MIFEKSISSYSDTNQLIFVAHYYSNQSLAEDQNGWIYLDQLDFGLVLGGGNENIEQLAMVNLLVQPIFALHFGLDGISDSSIATGLIYGGAQTLVYNEWDLDQDGGVNTGDILIFLNEFDVTYTINDFLIFLENFGPVGDATIEQGISIETANAAAFIASLSPSSPPGYPVKKDLYSTYSGPTAGRDVRGRTLTMEFSDTTSTPKNLFGIEVDYDLDVKTPRASVGRRPARAQGRRR